MTTGTITVHLKDGRTIDITGLEPEDAIAKMKANGVRHLDQIFRTVHYIPSLDLRSTNYPERQRP